MKKDLEEMKDALGTLVPGPVHKETWEVRRWKPAKKKRWIAFPKRTLGHPTKKSWHYSQSWHFHASVELLTLWKKRRLKQLYFSYTSYLEKERVYEK